METKNKDFINIKVEQLIEWDDDTGEGCMASNKITKDGWKVGYMYREVPSPNNPDSGWRFFKGDEDDIYLEDPDNWHVFSLNTICNYDPDIIPYIHEKIGSSYIRTDSHQLQKDDGQTPIYMTKQTLINEDNITD